MKKIWEIIKKHKKTSAVLGIIIIGGVWYYYAHSSGSGTLTYITRPVATGSIISSVSGTGQVSSSQQVSIYPKVSGDVVSVNVQNGDYVHKGDILVRLDDTTAGFSLQSAQISLSKLESSNPITVSSQQNSVSSAADALNQSYASAYNAVINSYNDEGTILTALDGMFNTISTSPYLSNQADTLKLSPQALAYRAKAAAELSIAQQEYSRFQQIYATLSPTATSSFLSILNQANSLAQDTLTATKDAAVTVNFIINQTDKSARTSAMTTDSANLTSWTTTMNSNAGNIISALSSIANNTRNLAQAQSSLTETVSGSAALDIASARLAVQQAQYTYNQYTIRAPFDGVVGNVTLKPADSVSGSTVIATVVTKDFISHISLNEVDAAKVAVGNPVQITFNALAGINATGTVKSVDSVGTVSQGVVSYDVVVTFSTDDTRVKAGMSVNATIITAQKDNVLVVPVAAVKNNPRGGSYVLVPAAGQTNKVVTNVTQKTVQVGLSDNTNTEIVSGLNVGDLVVTRTITTTSATTQQGNIFSSLSGGSRGSAGGGTGGARTSSAPASGSASPAARAQ